MVGRAGVGVDNVDVAEATKRGVIVVNAPQSNVLSAAEHTIALIMASARNIPQAHADLKAGRWEKGKWGKGGVEVRGKTLGIIGLGRIGFLVAEDARGLGMNVLAYDPFVPAEKFHELGLERADSPDKIYREADFITVHLPKNAETLGFIGDDEFAKMKDGRARRQRRPRRHHRRGRLGARHRERQGRRLRGRRVSQGADHREPAVQVRQRDRTPHLGASHGEAQQNVALQVAEQMADYLLQGAISNAVNFPSISAEEAPKLKPFVKLAELLGSFAGQLVEAAPSMIRLEYAGDVAELNTRVLTSAAVAGALRPLLQDINMVSAPAVAKERGIQIEEVRRGQEGAYETYMRVTLKTANGERAIGGTVFSDGKPRLIQINKISMDAEFSPTCSIRRMRISQAISARWARCSAARA